MSIAGLKLGYARVSTDDQDLTAQRDALAALGVAPARIDPVQAVGIAPNTPLPYWGWGARSPISTLVWWGWWGCGWGGVWGW